MTEHISVYLRLRVKAVSLIESRWQEDGGLINFPKTIIVALDPGHDRPRSLENVKKVVGSKREKDGTKAIYSGPQSLCCLQCSVRSTGTSAID